MVNLYTVIQNNSTAGASAQNPFIILYTRPDAGTNDAFWYKSKLFFGNNYGADVTGLKLFYTGSDPVGVHPEITGNNRIPLLFNSALSGNKLLANVQNESIMLGSLQTTNNTSPANAYSFVLQQLTIEWVLTPSILPIENGRLLCNVTSPTYLNTTTYNQAVTAVSFTGTTYDMGENSLVDVLLYATGIIATGNVRLDFSIDGITWFPNNTTTYSISGTDPHQTIIGLKTGSRYIRVSTGNASTFRADNLQMTFSSKRN